MKVLITGATGFVGKNILHNLSKSYLTVGFGSEHDLRDQAVCNNIVGCVSPDFVVHAAGSVGGIQANKNNPGKFMYDNLIMGTNIIHSCKKYNAKLILLGTVCSYPKFTQVPFKEHDLWSGYPEETNAPYGIAKKTLMTLLEVYHEEYGLKGVNLVPVNMFGPYDHFNLTSSHVIPALILKVQDAIINKLPEIEVWGTGQVSREFLYVKDFAECVRLAIKNDIGPSPINVGTGQEIKICDLINLICEIMGYNGEIKYNSTKPDGQPRRCLDVSQATEKLGFTARTTLREGLIDTIKWFENNRTKI